MITRDADGNIDCTADYNNDDYPTATGKVTDTCRLVSDDFSGTVAKIREAASVLPAFEQLSVVAEDATFMRVIVSYTTHDVIYDITRQTSWGAYANN